MNVRVFVVDCNSASTPLNIAGDFGPKRKKRQFCKFLIRYIVPHIIMFEQSSFKNTSQTIDLIENYLLILERFVILKFIFYKRWILHR